MNYTLPFKYEDKIIEFGGGNNPLFHPNCDIRNVTGVDKVIDLNTPLPISNEEYDGVYSKYSLEHINWRNVKNFLRESYRILKPNGKVVFITANLLEQARVLVNVTEWNDNLLGMIFGADDYKENTHQCGFSPDYITQMLKEIGFSNIKIFPIASDFGNTDMMVEASKETKKEIVHSVQQSTIKTIHSPKYRGQWILDHCEIGKKILDIGSNKGHVFNGSKVINNVTSVDIDKYDIPNFYQMDAHNLKFENKSFDIGNLAEILEHVENPVQVMKEANRVCKKLLITVPDEYNWAKDKYPLETIEEGSKRKNLTIEQMAKEGNPTATELYSKDGYKHLWHNRHYTEDTLKEDLKNAGITKYRMERLQYEGWSFFVVETKETRNPIVAKDIKLRIALISTPFFTVPPLGYSGLEQIVWDLAEALDELGHEVTIFAPEGSKPTCHGELITTGQSISTVNVNWYEEEKKNYEIYKDIITPDKFDIVHDHSWFGFPYLLKLKYPNLKVTHTHHGGCTWSSAPPIAKPNLVAISDFMKQYTINYFAQKGDSVGCERVYNGIDLTKYIFDPSIEKTNRLLYVGRFSSFKGVHTAIELAKKVNLPIDLVGGSFVDNPSYMQQIESMCDNDKIVMYKDTSHEFKIDKMQKAKAIIIPSQMNEPLNLVSLEGQACGSAIICTRDGGLPETVVQGVTGFVCDNMSDMIAAIEDIDKIKPEDCRKHIEDNFSRQVMTENYLRLYEKIQNNQEW